MYSVRLMCFLFGHRPKHTFEAIFIKDKMKACEATCLSCKRSLTGVWDYRRLRWWYMVKTKTK